MSSIVSRGSKHKVMGARDDFDLPKYELNKLTRVYYSAASRTPLMKKTYEMGQAAMARQMQTPWSIADEDDELKVRETFATLLNCEDSVIGNMLQFINYFLQLFYLLLSLK